MRAVRVAVVDSGIDAHHPALRGCVDPGVALEVVGDEVTVAAGPHQDQAGHGTACAGIIHGLAPEARLTSVRVLGPGLVGQGAAFVEGLGWAVEQRFDVINLSLGTTDPCWALRLHEVCDEAYFANCVVVTAADNWIWTSFPSLYSSVLSVAAHAEPGIRANPAPPPELLAPGVDVEVVTGAVVTGNSYAAAHVAGLVARMRSVHPGLRPFQVKARLWADR